MDNGEKIHETLSVETLRMLELLADLHECTQAEALRRAIATEAFIQREIKNGSKVFVRKPDGELKELFFR